MELPQTGASLELFAVGGLQLQACQGTWSFQYLIDGFAACVEASTTTILKHHQHRTSRQLYNPRRRCPPSVVSLLDRPGPLLLSSLCPSCSLPLLLAWLLFSSSFFCLGFPSSTFCLFHRTFPALSTSPSNFSSIPKHRFLQGYLLVSFVARYLGT